MCHGAWRNGECGLGSSQPISELPYYDGPVALDPGDVAISVGDGGEAAGGVIPELVECGLGQGVERAEVSPGGGDYQSK